VEGDAGAREDAIGDHDVEVHEAAEVQEAGLYPPHPRVFTPPPTRARLGELLDPPSR
jgi:hypothetical protein